MNSSSASRWTLVECKIKSSLRLIRPDRMILIKEDLFSLCIKLYARICLRVHIFKEPMNEPVVSSEATVPLWDV